MIYLSDMKYKKNIQTIDTTRILQKVERDKYKLKLYALTILYSSELEDLKKNKKKMTTLERDLANMLWELNETCKHAVNIIDWFENETEALLTQNNKLKNK